MSVISGSVVSVTPWTVCMTLSTFLESWYLNTHTEAHNFSFFILFF